MSSCEKQTVVPSLEAPHERLIKAQAATIASQRERILVLEREVAHRREMEWNLYRRHIHRLKHSWLVGLIPATLRSRLKQAALRLLRR